MAKNLKMSAAKKRELRFVAGEVVAMLTVALLEHRGYLGRGKRGGMKKKTRKR